ncbi:MAG: hypothetical protein Q9165_004117 [Trypethelium subeluteriae]
MSSLETTPKGAVSPRNSGVPLLQRESSETPKAAGSTSQDTDDNHQDENTNLPAKLSKRRLFGLGKKKDERIARKDNQSSSTEATPPATATTVKPTSSSMAAVSNAARDSESPQRQQRQSIQVATSPHRRMRSSSPRMHSPASSQIFERDVQETASLAGDLSPNIPSHITTENHIPPVLEASSIAITDDHLDPDSVEILTHSVHQPAALTVTGGAAEIGAFPPSQEDALSQAMISHHEFTDDGASNYGVAYDNSDPRRLSFISFADVVQAEHVGGSRDSVHLMSQSSTAPSVSANRSPSPIRSPVSGLGTSPPTSGAASFKGLETSPSRGMGIQMAGSPTSASSPPNFGGELMVETMRQALDKTGSGDMTGSKPLSAVSADDVPISEQHPFK